MRESGHENENGTSLSFFCNLIFFLSFLFLPFAVASRAQSIVTALRVALNAQQRAIPHSLARTGAGFIIFMT